MPEINEENVSLKELTKSFINLCKVAYETWQMYKTICAYPCKSKIDKSVIWEKLSYALSYHVILQIAKIHDPAKHWKNYNLSLEYFVDRVGGTSYKNSHSNFLKDNKKFIAAIKEARDKVVAHPDLETYISNARKGIFDKGLDQKYFDSLYEIISEGYRELCLDPDSFEGWPSFIADDTKAFMKKINGTFNA